MWRTCESQVCASWVLLFEWTAAHSSDGATSSYPHSMPQLTDRGDKHSCCVLYPPLDCWHGS